jgi:hypothetical protein
MRWFYHPWRVVFAVLFACLALTFARTSLAQAGPETTAPPPSASVAASSSAIPIPAPAASASAKPAATAEVRVRDRVILTLRASRAERSAQERARAANDAIASLLAHPEEIGDVRHEDQQGSAVVFVGKTPIVTLGPEDAEAAGETSVGVLAAQVTTRLADAMSTERKRSAIATTVFSFSLLIFSALIAFLLLQRVSDVAARMREWLVEDPAKITALRLGKIEFVSAGAARGALSIALTLGHRLIQLTIAYGWLILALSLFEATRVSPRVMLSKKSPTKRTSTVTATTPMAATTTSGSAVPTRAARP